MTENEPTKVPSVSEAHQRLLELSQLLRSGPPLGDAARQPLADLVAEVDRLLSEGNVPPGEITRLLESVTHLADSLRHERSAAVSVSTRERLRQAAQRLEALDPDATSLLQRIVETLANIGI